MNQYLLAIIYEPVVLLTSSAKSLHSLTSMISNERLYGYDKFSGIRFIQKQQNF